MSARRLFNQLLQTLLGVAAGWDAAADFFGDEEYQVAVWAARFRGARRLVPAVLAALGIDARDLEKALPISSLGVDSLLAGCKPENAFGAWELRLGKLGYYVVIPVLQFTFAVLIADSWQFFGHRWMHSNKFMYKHIHFTHHTLNVPYAYGSLYTHPLEGLLQDTLGVALAFHLTTMSTRQGMLFYFASTVKDVHDHCRYALPWIMVHSAATYHDLHHQSWGGKWNFSVYTCFWDWVFGTLWTDGEAARRCYEKGVEVTGVVRAGVGKFEIPETPVDCGGRDLGPKVE